MTMSWFVGKLSGYTCMISANGICYMEMLRCSAYLSHAAASLITPKSKQSQLIISLYLKGGPNKENHYQLSQNRI